VRDARWSEAIAVGNLGFVERKETHPLLSRRVQIHA
jgi:hypothetical protein